MYRWSRSLCRTFLSVIPSKHRRCLLHGLLRGIQTPSINSCWFAPRNRAKGERRAGALGWLFDHGAPRKGTVSPPPWARPSTPATAHPRGPLLFSPRREQRGAHPAVVAAAAVFCSPAPLALWRFPIVWAINILSGWMFIFFETFTAGALLKKTPRSSLQASATGALWWA